MNHCEEREQNIAGGETRFSEREVLMGNADDGSAKMDKFDFFQPLK